MGTPSPCKPGSSELTKKPDLYPYFGSSRWFCFQSILPCSGPVLLFQAMLPRIWLQSLFAGGVIPDGRGVVPVGMGGGLIPEAIGMFPEPKLQPPGGNWKASLLLVCFCWMLYEALLLPSWLGVLAWLPM